MKKIKVSNEVELVNKEMVLFYADREVYPIRIRRGAEDKVIYIFDKAQTQDVYHIWKEWVKAHKKHQSEDQEEIEVSYKQDIEGR